MLGGQRYEPHDGHRAYAAIGTFSVTGPRIYRKSPSVQIGVARGRDRPPASPPV